MGSSIDDITGSVHGLFIADDAPQDLGQEALSSAFTNLGLGEDYAASFQLKIECRLEAQNTIWQRRSWHDFWNRVLNNSLDTVPQYLFRIFDQGNSGQNDGSVMSSMSSISGSQESSQADILTMDEHEAAELLAIHLNRDFSEKAANSVITWTSSLLFAVQYAISRVSYGKATPSDIKICVVDTWKSPQGQFAPDISLVKAFYATAIELGGEIQDFFDFRVEHDHNYHRKYVCQGEVNLADRACVFSLEQLIEAGLFQLYPELGDLRHMIWPNRVHQLQQNWAEERGTTYQEIDLALNISGNCFSRFEPLDIASILLSFKNRRLNHLLTPDLHKQRPKWADKPVEVSRYWSTTEAVKSCKELQETGFYPRFELPASTLRLILDFE